MKSLRIIFFILFIAFQIQGQTSEKTTWNGFARYDFKFNDRDATIVFPDKPAEGQPWVWRPAFFGAFAQVDSALLHRGFHIAYYDLTHCYGSPHAMTLGKEFYDMATKRFNLSKKVTLEGLSRGGFYAFRWAAQFPDCTACVYADAPVCDLFSWPSRNNSELWQGVLKEWDKTDKAMNSFQGNVIDNLEPIIKARIPIMAVCGSADKVVPFKDNMQPVFERLTAAGCPVEIIIKPDCNHHPHSLTDPTPIVDFIVRNQPGFQSKQDIQVRGDMNNSYIKFRDTKKGCVAFLGGSITEMNGWRNMIEDDLKQRFPDTEFTFIEAGISSTGSTPGAFRFENDVLAKGIPDLLFIDAAVNDHTNYFNATEQVRGMEGEIRHALLANQNMDIVQLNFIYDPFIDIVHQDSLPDVLFNFGRVANHYKISSVNMISEIVNRMDTGEFDWDTFGGTHPKPFGHTFYAAAINHLFDIQWNAPKGTSIKPHEIPEKPLDEFSYYNGKFVAVSEAKNLKGWAIDNNWQPVQNNTEKKISTREKFVNVPMLASQKAGATFTLDFTGTAVGIFCVAGPKAADLEYSIDGAPFKTLTTYTEWSNGLYIPWVYMFETELSNSRHTLTVRTAKTGKGTECQIRNFVVNGK